MTADLVLWSVEAPILLGSRLTFGDEAVAEYVFSQDYHPGFVGRHTHQLASLYETQFVEGHT